MRLQGVCMGKADGKIHIDTERCKGCGLCITACPQNCLQMAKDVDRRGIRVACRDGRKNCTGCTLCYVVCPDVAITVYKAAADGQKTKT